MWTNCAFVNIVSSDHKSIIVHLNISVKPTKPLQSARFEIHCVLCRIVGVTLRRHISGWPCSSPSPWKLTDMIPCFTAALGPQLLRFPVAHPSHTADKKPASNDHARPCPCLLIRIMWLEIYANATNLRVRVTSPLECFLNAQRNKVTTMKPVTNKTYGKWWYPRKDQFNFRAEFAAAVVGKGFHNNQWFNKHNKFIL